MMNYGSVIGKYSPNPDYNIPTYFTYYDKTIEADQDVLFYAIDKSKDRSAYEGYDSMYYVDGSFFKLKNVTLGYTLPGKLTKRFGISNPVYLFAKQICEELRSGNERKHQLPIVS